VVDPGFVVDPVTYRPRNPESTAEMGKLLPVGRMRPGADGNGASSLRLSSYTTGRGQSARHLNHREPRTTDGRYRWVMGGTGEVLSPTPNDMQISFAAGDS
jgi:hypothetical protein